MYPPAISRSVLVCLAAGSTCSIVLLFEGVINQRLSVTLHHGISILFIVASILMLADLTSLSESKQLHKAWHKIQISGTIVSSLGLGTCITEAVLNLLEVGSTGFLSAGTFFSLFGIGVVGFSSGGVIIRRQVRYLSLLTGIFCLQWLLPFLLPVSSQQLLYHFMCDYSILWIIVRYIACEEYRSRLEHNLLLPNPIKP